MVEVGHKPIKFSYRLSDQESERKEFLIGNFSQLSHIAAIKWRLWKASD